MLGIDRMKELVAGLGEQLGANLNLDRDGHCCVEVDGNIFINFQWQDAAGSAVVYSSIGELPEEVDRLDFCEDLLHANFFWHETAGATLSLDQDTGLVVLCARIFPEQLELVSDFKRQIESWVNVVAQWRDRLARLPEIASAPPASTESPLPANAESGFDHRLRA